MFAVIISYRPGLTESKILDFGNELRKEVLDYLVIYGNDVVSGIDIKAVKNDVHLSVRLQPGNDVSFSFHGPDYNPDTDVSTYQICVFETLESAHRWLNELFPPQIN